MTERQSGVVGIATPNKPLDLIQPGFKGVLDVSRRTGTARNRQHLIGWDSGLDQGQGVEFTFDQKHPLRIGPQYPVEVPERQFGPGIGDE